MQSRELNSKTDVLNRQPHRSKKYFGLAAFLMMFLWALGTEAMAGPIAIGSCQVIDKPGSYELYNNLEAKAGQGNCIVINADFVTIDLGGYTIIGAGSGAGITQARPVNAVTVRNGKVTNFSAGIFLGDNTTVERVQAYKNTGTGISVSDTSQVKDCLSTHNGGSGIDVGRNGIMTGNIASYNQGGGLQCGAGSCVITGNTATHNSLGIAAYSSVISNNIANDNARIGIFAPNNIGGAVLSSTISNNTVQRNGENGIFFNCPSSVHGNTVVGNGVNVNSQCVTDKDHNATLP